MYKVPWKHPGASLGFLLRPTDSEPYPSLIGATWGLRRATWIPGEATWMGDPAESAVSSGLGNPDSGSESRAAGRGSLVRSPAPPGPGLRLGRCLVTGLGSLPMGRFGRTAAANRAPASGRIRPRRGLGFPVRPLPFRSVSRFAPMPLEAHADLAVGSSSLQIIKIRTGSSVAASHDPICSVLGDFARRCREAQAVLHRFELLRLTPLGPERCSDEGSSSGRCPS